MSTIGTGVHVSYDDQSQQPLDYGNDGQSQANSDEDWQHLHWTLVGNDRYILM